MARATYRSALPALAVLLALAAGCGGARRSMPGRVPVGAAFAAVRAAAPPAGWRATRIPSGAVLSYPPGWTIERGDAGTATAVLHGAHLGVLGYLNVTPRQGDESLVNWTAFRLAHNAREGDREVTSEATARGVHFRSGAGSCVRDSYVTSSGAHYIEIACLVEGARATSVVVAASPPGTWAAVAPELYRALSALTT